METLELGFAPHAEDCAQVGQEGYPERARRECRALRNQLVRAAAAAGVVVPEGMLVIKSSSHDFGTYYELVAKFADDDEPACEVALWLEENMPERWDDAAKRELGLVTENA